MEKYGGVSGVERLSKKKKKEKILMDVDNSVVIAGRREIQGD